MAYALGGNTPKRMMRARARPANGTCAHPTPVPIVDIHVPVGLRERRPSLLLRRRLVASAIPPAVSPSALITVAVALPIAVGRACGSALVHPGSLRGTTALYAPQLRKHATDEWLRLCVGSSDSEQHVRADAIGLVGRHRVALCQASTKAAGARPSHRLSKTHSMRK